MRCLELFTILSWTICTKFVTIGAFEQNPKGPIFKNDVTNCIMDIAFGEFGQYILLGVSSSFNMSPPTAEIQDMVLKKLHMAEKWSIEIVNSDDFDADKPVSIQRSKHHSHQAAHLNFAEKRKNVYYIIIVDTPEEFYEAFRSFSTKQSFNPTAKILVFCTKCYDIITVRWVLLKLWGQFCTNTALLTTSLSLQYLPLYALELFNPATICGDNITLNLLGSCHRGRMSLKSQSNIFIDRVPSDLNGCMLFAIARQWPPFVINTSSETEPGTEVFTLQTIAKLLNFRINFTQFNKGLGRRVNGSWKGMLGRIKRREVIFAIGNIRPDQMIYEDFSLSTSYLEVRMSWVVPKAQHVPPWRYPYVIFKASLWIMIVFSIVAASVIWFFLARSKSSKDIALKNFGVCVLNAITMAFGLANSNRPAGHLMRIVFTTISIFGIILNTIYQGFLIRIFTNPPYEYQVKTVQELLDANFSMGGVREFQEFYNDSTDPISWHIFNQYYTNQVNQSVLYYLSKVSKDRNFSTIVNKHLIRYLHSARSVAVTNRHGKIQVYSFDQDALVYPVGMVAENGFPLMKKINQLVLVFRENGILQKWYSDIETQINRQAARHEDTEKEDIKLTVVHLQGVFMSLLLGLLASLVLLCGEIVWSKNIIQKFIKNKFNSTKKYEDIHKVKLKKIQEIDIIDKNEIIPYCN